MERHDLDVQFLCTSYNKQSPFRILNPFMDGIVFSVVLIMIA